MQTITEHGKALISDDPDEKDDNNHEIEDLEEEFESTQLSEFPAIIFPSQMVYWTDHLTVERLTIRLLLPSGCAPGDIDAVISPGGLEVVVTYKWPEVIMNAMALFEMYSTPTGSLKYPETHLKIGAFAANTCELHSEQPTERFCSIQKFPLAFQFQEKFTDAEGHDGKEYLQMLDESTNLLLEMLNLELEALHTSYDHIKPAIPVCVFTFLNTAEAACCSDGKSVLQQVQCKCFSTAQAKSDKDSIFQESWCSCSCSRTILRRC